MHPNIDFLGKRRLFMTVSLLLLAGAVTAISTIGFNYGIDFAGGTSVQLKFTEAMEVGTLRERLRGAGFSQPTIQQLGDPGDHEFLVRVPETGETTGPPAGAVTETEAENPAAPGEEDAPAPAAAAETAEAAVPESEAKPASGGSGTDVSERIVAAVQPMSVPAGSLDLNTADFSQIRSMLLERAVPLDEAEQAARAIMDYRSAHAGLLHALTDLDGLGLSEAALAALKEGGVIGGLIVRKVEMVGPKVGKDLRAQAVKAVGWSLLGILLYVGFRFRVEFAVAAIIALIHDTLFTVGILVTRGEEFTLLTISALLTLVGYSLNDSIVVFDRVRENLNQMRGAGLVEVINTSINQMLRRTILTSGTTLVAVLALLLLGGPVLHGFAFTLLIGIVVGTYSSIYIASPVLILWHRVRERRRQR